MNGQPVASNRPWYLLAYGDSPTVSVPYNGEAAIAAVLARYRVRWLVLSQPITGMGASRQVLQELVAGSRTHIGRLQLQRVPAPLAVFRVVDPESPST